jgi:hypothetical protein
VEKCFGLKVLVSTSFTARILSPDFRIVWRYLSLISMIRKISSEQRNQEKQDPTIGSKRPILIFDEIVVEISTVITDE